MIAAALHDHWREWYDQGLVGAVVDAAELLPESFVDEGLRHLIGRSHVLVGRSGEALEWFAALPPGPDRAFEFADVYTGRGELSKAFDVLVEALERYPDPRTPTAASTSRSWRRSWGSSQPAERRRSSHSSWRRKAVTSGAWRTRTPLSPTSHRRAGRPGRQSGITRLRARSPSVAATCSHCARRR